MYHRCIQVKNHFLCHVIPLEMKLIKSILHSTHNLVQFPSQNAINGNAGACGKTVDANVDECICEEEPYDFEEL